jgi:hypothetical protein
VALQLLLPVAGEVKTHHLGPDQDVGARPGLGAEAEEGEPRRQGGPRGQEGVHPGGVGVHRLLLLGVEPFVSRLGRAVEAPGAEEPVLGKRGLPQDLGEAPLAHPALELHLPEPLLGVNIALGEEEVLQAPRPDAHHALSVPNHLHRGGKALQAHPPLRLGQGRPQVDEPPKPEEEHENRRHQKRPSQSSDKPSHGRRKYTMLPMELLHAGLSGLAPEPAPLPKSWPESSSAWASARTSSPWPPFRPWSSWAPPWPWASP